MRALFNTVERLKRRYGARVTVIRITSAEINLNFEQAAVARESHEVTCVLLPKVESSKFQYDLAFNRVAPNFTFGGEVAEVDQVFVFTYSSFPSGFDFHISDQIIHSSHIYLPVKVTKDELNGFFVVGCKATKENYRGSIVSKVVNTLVSVTSDVQSELA